MKKILYSTFIASLIFFTSCQKSSLTSEDGLNNLPITREGQIKFAEQKLKILAEEIGKIANDKEFVNFIHNEVSKKFDDEYEVLIKNIRSGNKWSEQLNNEKISKALNAFQNIEGSNFYPQIYIPKMQTIEDNELKIAPGTNGSSIIEPIVYVVYAGNSEVDSASGAEVAPGYTTDVSGNLVYWGMVDSAYANNHEVWIYSINETVNNLGGAPCTEYFVNPDCDGNGGGDGGGGGGTPPCTGVDCDPLDEMPSRPNFPDLQHNKVNFKIENMVCKAWKESWLGGASEVCIRAVLSCHNDRDKGDPYPVKTEHYLSDQKSSYLGKLISKFKRKETRQQTIKNVNFSLQTNWQNQIYQVDPIYFDFLVFERDLWPAQLQKYYGHAGRADRIYSFNPYADSWNQWYRSATGGQGSTNGYEYVSGSFVNTTAFPNTSPNSYYNSGLVDNAYIKFNTIGY